MNAVVASRVPPAEPHSALAPPAIELAALDFQLLLSPSRLQQADSGRLAFCAMLHQQSLARPQPEPLVAGVALAAPPAVVPPGPGPGSAAAWL